jgi:hypothetical protein
MATYRYGDYSVTVHENGDIEVQAGDTLSAYSVAIHHGKPQMVHEFGRFQADGTLATIEDPDKIWEGEVIVHIPTWEKYICIEQLHDFRIGYDVPLIGQNSPFTCWYATLAMLAQWKINATQTTPLRPRHPSTYPPAQKAWEEHKGLILRDTDLLARELGFEVHALLSPSIDRLVKWMHKGPVGWVAFLGSETAVWQHGAVIRGLERLAGQQEVTVSVNDPLPIGKGKVIYNMPVRQFLKKYHFLGPRGPANLVFVMP